MYNQAFVITFISLFTNCYSAILQQDGCILPKIENGYAKTEASRSGYYATRTRVRIRCFQGYDRVGDHPLCLGKNEWSEMPTCVKRKANCRNPIKGTTSKDPVAEPDKSSYLEGDIISVRCKEGYYPSVKNATYTCSADGKFAGEIPSCIPVLCFQRGVPENLEMDPQKPFYTYRENVKYNCAWGYHPSSPIKSGICGKDGKITPSPPECIKTYCEKPQTKPGVSFYPEMRKYEPMESIVIRCNQGYTMEKEVIRLECMENGKFSGVIPRCYKETEKKTFCAQPSIPKFGRISLIKTVFRLGEKIIFFCDEGYNMIGAKEATCEGNGRFSASSPSCVAVTCPLPKRISNGNVSPYNAVNQYKSRVEYTCSEGFKLIGDKYLTCSQKGVFEPWAPKCIKMATCKNPGLLENGERSNKNEVLQVGDAIVYRCSKGYVLVGSSRISCLFIGELSGEKPFCKKEAACPKPRNPKNGQVTFPKSVGFVGKAIYICDKGYSLIGERISTCINGEYTPPPPICQIVSCDALPPLRNGYYGAPNDITYGTTIKFHCDSGYKLVGKESILCQSNGKYSEKLPKCLRTCKLPSKLPRHLQIAPSKGLYVLNDEITFRCQTEYVLNGVQKAYCTESGLFSSFPKSCKAKERSCENSCEYSKSASCQCDFFCSFYDNCCKDQSDYCDTYSFY